MPNTKPARGMRDFLPSDVRKREYVINIIKEVYESYGFEPLETPSVENLETLTGKYGEEGNQLIFKILKRGEKLQEELNAGAIKSENELSDLALRYDLTVPLARVVANYKNDLPKFFKRYQIQPVWRADRPARGRFREFYQCDVDAIGSNSMIVEAEQISAVCEILQRLGFEDFEILLNHRELLTSILNAANIPSEKHADTLVALDKLEKIGLEALVDELISRDIPQKETSKVIEFYTNILKLEIEYSKQNIEAMQKRKKLLESIGEIEKNMSSKDEINIKLNSFYGDIKLLSSLNHEISHDIKEFISNQNQTGLEKIREIVAISKTFATKDKIRISPSLARGLSYYTGAIMEIVLTKGDFAGSIGGGGRYDGLIGMFGKEQIPACGFSLGLERILVVMEERGMFPKELSDASADVMVTIWNAESTGESLKLAAELRSQNLRVLVYPEADKLGKQFKYADSIKIPFVCVLGENELAENKVTLKNLQTGEQETVNRDEIAAKIKS